ncbi:MAG: hypothetical protein JNL34_05010, partial [Anaerolineae bacterium]|nr:hypothetical protein [Anaerolineae bacterium]
PPSALTPDPSPSGRGGKGGAWFTDFSRLPTTGIRPVSTWEQGKGDEGWITPTAFTAHAGAVDEAARAAGLTPSTFERATALAFLWFAGQRVEFAVCEIGLGGRFDAVNAAPNVLALIGPLEREHAAMLGGTLEHIAWHKAGVIAPGGVAVALPPTEPLVRAVIEAEAAQKGAALVFADDIAAAGLTVLRERGIAPPGASIPEEIALPGRLERAEINGRRVLIDGGHTALAARRLAETIAPELAGGVCVVVGMLADKDATAYLRELDAPGVRLICTTAPAGRAFPAEQLAEVYAPQHAHITVETSFERALVAGMAAEAGLTVVAGSLRMVAAAREAFGLLDAAALDEARRTRALFAGEGYRARWEG